MSKKTVLLTIVSLSFALPAFARSFDEKLADLFGETVVHRQAKKHLINIYSADRGIKLGTCEYVYSAVEVQCRNNDRQFLGDVGVFND